MAETVASRLHPYVRRKTERVSLIQALQFGDGRRNWTRQPAETRRIRPPVEPLTIGRLHGNGADPMRIGLLVHGRPAGQVFDRLYKPAADRMVVGMIESNLTVPAYSSGQKRPVVKPKFDSPIGVAGVVGQNHAEVAASKTVKSSGDEVQHARFSVRGPRPLKTPVETEGEGRIPRLSQDDGMPAWLQTLEHAISLQQERVPRLLEEMGKYALKPRDVERAIMLLLPQDRKYPQQYLETLCDIFTDSIMTHPSNVKLNNGFVGRLMRECELSTAHRLGDALYRKDARVRLHSIGHLVHRLAQHEGYKTTALKFLLWAQTLKGEANRTEVLASLATTILHRQRGPVKAARLRLDPKFASWELFEPIVRSGIPLNSFIITAWLRRTCMEGQMRIAIELAKFLKADSDITTDNVFFSTLLHGAKLSQTAPVIDKTVEMLGATGLQTAWLYNDMIHALFHHARGESFDFAVDQQKGLPSFAYMVQIYSKIYNMAPLAELIKPVSLDGVLQEPLTSGWHFATMTFPIMQAYVERHAPDTLLQPNIPVLTSMVIGLVGNMSMVENVRSFWDHFRALVRQGHPIACAVVNGGGTRIYDACIRRISTVIVDDTIALRTILGMVDTMLKEGFPRPSVYTWNVVLSSYLVRRELKPAVEIVQTMRALGVTPDVETWSKLAIAYADAGEREKYAIVLRLMDLEGMSISRRVESHMPRSKNPPMSLASSVRMA